MVRFVDVDPNEIDNIRQGRRGRVSYPILKGFLETGKYLVQLDTTGMQQSHQSLTSSLNSYIRNHRLPIKLFQRRGRIYLMRLDIDEDGEQINDWELQQYEQHQIARSAEPLTPDLVEEQFEKAKDDTAR